MKQLLVALAAAGVVAASMAACATGAAYGPAASPNKVGYSEHLRLTNMHGCAVNACVARRNLDRTYSVCGKERPHRHD